MLKWKTWGRRTRLEAAKDVSKTANSVGVIYPECL